MWSPFGSSTSTPRSSASRSAAACAGTTAAIAPPVRQPAGSATPIEASASTAGSAETATAIPALARIGSSIASASGSVRSPEATIHSPVSVPSAPSGPWIRSGGEKASAGIPLSSRSFSADSQAVE